MSKSFNQIYVHIIFHVGKSAIIKSDTESELYAYMRGLSKILSSQILEMNGTDNHVHILVSLSPTISVGEFVNKIKSNSSRWMKKVDKDFSWQRGYGAFSVSSSVCVKVRRYIKKQKEHHKVISYQDELQSFLEHYNLE
ncbi:IS200/IS605 family transposase [Lentisphaera profundi]|uniref:IS200/IS605 family transposase n=1 Tax=Lentisphaera profundi TaxID=1658616 RepID=A0ABY7VW00_9BACT|nr:IS200/IS605 family transposase [Lentisphaera profundi]WDE96909.1 IS200/IS605 family transposase [Lentisphaera profundi]